LYDSVVRSTLGVPRGDAKNSPPIMKEYMDAAEKAGMSPKNQKSFINFVNMMQERSLPDEKAYRIGKAFFDPKNQGLVGKWASDQYDPRTGKVTEGQISVFRLLGSEGTAQRVAELSKNPKYADLFTDYTNFMQNTFKREVFPTLMDDIKNLSVTGSGNRLSFKPDDSPNRPFSLDPIDLGAAKGLGVARQGAKIADRPLQSAVFKLNYLWETMGNVAKISGEKNPNAYILRLLIEERPDMFSNEVRGFPSEINQSIKNQMLGREMEKKKEEERKAKNLKESQ
jgi:hypothetical protein